jgi:hypothetical protein
MYMQLCKVIETEESRHPQEIGNGGYIMRITHEGDNSREEPKR